MDLAASKNGFRFESIPNLLHSLSLVGVGGALAFAMEVAEFAIVQIASSLTLSIIGVTKVSTKAINSILEGVKRLNVIVFVILLSKVRYESCSIFYYRKWFQ